MITAEYLECVGLGQIARKVDHGERLSREDGMLLYEHPDLNAVGYLANQVRERLNGNLAYYNVNQHINPTNVCNKFCKFCAFYRTPRDSDAYALTREQIQARVREKLHEPITEIHSLVRSGFTSGLCAEESSLVPPREGNRDGLAGTSRYQPNNDRDRHVFEFCRPSKI